MTASDAKVGVLAVSNTEANLELLTSSIVPHVGAINLLADLRSWMNNSHAASNGARSEDSGLDCLILVGPLSSIVPERLIQKISDKAPGLPIVVIARLIDVRSAIEAMKQGAFDVCESTADGDKLVETVTSAAAKGASNRLSRLHVEDLRYRLTLLSPGEEDVLAALLEGMANKQIAQSVGIGLRTVELRRSKILRKMQAKSVAELVKYVCEARGHVLPGSGEQVADEADSVAAE